MNNGETHGLDYMSVVLLIKRLEFVEARSEDKQDTLE